MKRELFLILLLVAITLSGMAQNVSEAFYIYRNDGDFNAFFRDEEQSIDYSYEDADGNTYDEIVTQIVTTADSIYKIPIAAIDSVAFVQPKTIYKPSVRQLEEIASYVISVNERTIVFSGVMPSQLVPHKGDVLFFEKCISPFPNGFAGIVSSVESNNNIVVSCSQASLTDIYEQMVTCQRYEVENGSTPKKQRRAAGDYNADREGFHVPLTADATLLSHSASLAGDIYLRGNGKWVFRQLPDQPTFADLSLTVDVTTDVQATLSESFSIDHDFQGIEIPVRLPYGLQATLQLVPFIETSVTGGLEMSYSTFNTHTFGARYEDGQFSSYHTSASETSAPELALKGKAEIFVGGKLSGSVGTFANLIQMGVAVKAGYHAEGELTAYSSTIDNTDNYQLSKNDQVTTSLRAAAEATAGIYLGPASLEATVPFFIRDYVVTKNYILPIFTTPAYQRNNSDVVVTTKVNRNLAGAVEVGLALYDEDNNLVETKFDERPYRLEEEFADSPVELSFSGVNTSKLYKVYPVVRFSGQTYRATPAKQIGTPIYVEQTEAVGTCGGEVAFKARMAPTIATDEEEGVTGRGIAIYYGEKLIKEYPVNMSQPSDAIIVELTCHSDSLTENWDDFTATTADYWTVTTYTDYVDVGRTYHIEDAQPLELVYDQKPGYEFLSVEYDPSRFEEEVRYLDDGNGQTASYLFHLFYWNDKRRITGTYWWEYCYNVVEPSSVTNENPDPRYGIKDDEEYEGWNSSGARQRWYYSEDIGYHDFYWDYREWISYFKMKLRNGYTINGKNALHVSGTFEDVPQNVIIDLSANSPIRQKVKNRVLRGNAYGAKCAECSAVSF